MTRFTIYYIKSVIYIIFSDIIKKTTATTANCETGYIINKVPFSIYTLLKTDMLGYIS